MVHSTHLMKTVIRLTLPKQIMYLDMTEQKKHLKTLNLFQA